MKKGVIYSLFLSVLLAACSAEEAKEESVTEAEEVEEEIQIPTSEEEWASTLEDSGWYESVNTSGEVLFEHFLDFDGDGIQEIIIGTNSMENKEAVLHIGEYSIEEQEWSILHKESHDYVMFKEPRFYGVLDNGNGTQVAAISIFNAGGSANSEEFRLIKFREGNQQRQIIDGFNHSMTTDQPNPYEVDVEKQKIIINYDTMSVVYTLLDNFLTSEDGSKSRLYTGAPITKNEEFITLLGNSYFKTGTYFGDTYETAIANDSNVVDKGEVEGAKVVLFEDYAIYHDYFDPFIRIISFHGFKDLLVTNLEEVIGQQVNIESYYDVMNDEEVSTFEFMFEGYRYVADVSSAKENAVIEELRVYNDL